MAQPSLSVPVRNWNTTSTLSTKSLQSVYLSQSTTLLSILVSSVPSMSTSLVLRSTNSEVVLLVVLSSRARATSQVLSGDRNETHSGPEPCKHVSSRIVFLHAENNCLQFGLHASRFTSSLHASFSPWCSRSHRICCRWHDYVVVE